MSDYEFMKLEPLTKAELDTLAYVSASSFALGIVCFVLCLGAAIYVSVKTAVPGRHMVLISFILLIILNGYEQYMGGNLEWVFGPIANLYKVIAYCSILLIFCIGYVRACRYFVARKNH